MADHAPATRPLTQKSTSHSNQACYRDLVIFEERLRGNMVRLQTRKRKFEALLIVMLLLLVYFFYAVFLAPSKAFIIHLANTTALLGTAGSLVFFYRSGMYSEKIVFAAQFVPHCNRALSSFSLQFNRKGSSGELCFYSHIPKKFQDGFYARKKARQAKAKAA